eukprot:SAG11_NODE_3811_length_2212_cov_0.942735_3_plen_77_part_01
MTTPQAYRCDCTGTYSGINCDVGPPPSPPPNSPSPPSASAPLACVNMYDDGVNYCRDLVTAGYSCEEMFCGSCPYAG